MPGPTTMILGGTAGAGVVAAGASGTPGAVVPAATVARGIA